MMIGGDMLARALFSGYLFVAVAERALDLIDVPGCKRRTSTDPEALAAA